MWAKEDTWANETIMKGIPSNISATQLNTYFANTVQAAGYGLVAGRIEMMGIRKQTSQVSHKPCSAFL